MVLPPVLLIFIKRKRRWESDVKSIYDLKIATKLLMAFSAVLILTGFLGIFSIIQLSKVNQTATELETEWMPDVQALLEIKASMQRIRTLEYASIIFTDPENAPKVQTLLDGSLNTFKNNSEKYAKLISLPEEKRLYAEFTGTWEKYLAEHQKVVQFLKEGNEAKVKETIAGDSLKLNGLLTKELDEMVARSGLRYQFFMGAVPAAIGVGLWVVVYSKFMALGGPKAYVAPE